MVKEPQNARRMFVWLRAVLKAAENACGGREEDED